MVRALAEELDAAAAATVLRNAHAGEEAVRLVAEQQIGRAHV